MRSILLPVTLLTLTGARLAAQETQIQARVPAPKAEVIDRVMAAMADAGATITEATPAGHVSGVYYDGNVILELHAAVISAGAGSRVVLGGFVSARGNFATGNKGVSAALKSDDPREGARAWAKLQQIAQSVQQPVGGQP